MAITQDDLGKHREKQDMLARELLVDHFGFEPVEFIDDVINSVNSLMYQTLSALEEFVEDQIGEEEASAGMVAVETLLENAIDKNLDIFEVFALKNVFKIPNDISLRLPHYEGIQEDATKEDLIRADQEVEYFEHKMKAKLHTLNQEIPLLMTLRDEITRISNPPNLSEVYPVPETSHFVNECIQQIREISTSALQRADAVSSADLVAHKESRTRAITEIVGRYLQKMKSSEKSSDAMDTDVPNRVGAIGGMVSSSMSPEDVNVIRSVGPVPEELKSAVFTPSALFNNSSR
ncbi:hypothetical protein HDU76_009847 [Blyttiomyces sp. JEL0837]|nr:hypothetical protein HDU76_009847 [Blyttiomyces sp. JEL0837]